MKLWGKSGKRGKSKREFADEVTWFNNWISTTFNSHELKQPDIIALPHVRY